MTALNDRPNTALLVIDVQNGRRGRRPRRATRVIANINALVDKARAEDVPVIWVQHSDDGLLVEGSDGWQYVAELSATTPSRSCTSATATRSRRPSSRTLLAERGVGRLVVTGAQTDACIRSTLHGALVRGYDATLGRGRPHHRGPERRGVRRSTPSR